MSPEVERHYWQLRTHPAMTPDGTPLGYALFCTEFPELPPNFDEYVAEFGMDELDLPNTGAHRRNGGLQDRGGSEGVQR